MKVNVWQGALQSAEVDTLIVNLFHGVQQPGGATGAVDQALGGAIRELIEQGDLSGKAGEVAALYPRGKVPAKRVLVVGLGKQEALSLEAVRRAAAVAIKRAQALGAEHVATVVHGAGVGGMVPAEAAQAVVEGSVLALYRYRNPGTDDAKQAPVALTLCEFDERKFKDLDAGVRIAKAVTAGVTLARDLVNMPPNQATPGKLAEVARDLSERYGFDLTVGDREWAAEHKMGAFLAVTQGAETPPHFIVMEHNPAGSDEAPVVLVGKGITFDSGGLSLKSRDGMITMKSDMGGAGAVLGAMKTVGELALGKRVVALIPTTENMPDGKAYRPSDVITASNGKTIEIISTDAEGRLALADALVYAQRYKPKVVIDLATLTGSCKVALGADIAAGLFSNDETLQETLMQLGLETHERVWPLPLWDDYQQALESDVADMKNSGGRAGGVGTSAIFLKAFTDYSWTHLDIASMAYTSKSGAYTRRGGTGYGVRLLSAYLQRT